MDQGVFCAESGGFMIRHEDLFEDTAFFHFHFSAFTDNKQNETPDEHLTVFSKMQKKQL